MGSLPPHPSFHVPRSTFHFPHQAASRTPCLWCPLSAASARDCVLLQWTLNIMPTHILPLSLSLSFSLSLCSCCFKCWACRANPCLPLLQLFLPSLLSLFLLLLLLLLNITWPALPYPSCCVLRPSWQLVKRSSAVANSFWTPLQTLVQPRSYLDKSLQPPFSPLHPLHPSLLPPHKATTYGAFKHSRISQKQNAVQPKQVRGPAEMWKWQCNLFFSSSTKASLYHLPPSPPLTSLLSVPFSFWFWCFSPGDYNYIKCILIWQSLHNTRLEESEFPLSIHKYELLVCEWVCREFQKALNSLDR